MVPMAILGEYLIVGKTSKPISFEDQKEQIGMQAHAERVFVSCFHAKVNRMAPFVVQHFRWIKIFEKVDDRQFWVTLACPQYVGSVTV